jgi:putative membrane protein insertion efficiency factor
MRKLYIFLIRLYQLFVSPIMTNVFGARCRFSMTCSEYAIQKIEEGGVITGSIKAIKRLARCQPFTKIYEYS